ncbi:MAG TPA: nucleotidyltransferase family protein [Sphingobium sp.]|uniref:nucleotidyltransferase domain-containing protein n=1 Tax=Sphingobium sp. TaxID=1912891 RepID=UPI002ED2E25F
MSAALLIAILRDPASAAGLAPDGWTRLFATARSERLMGALAQRLGGLAVSPRVAPILADARFDAEAERRQALWEADRAKAAMAGLNIPVILLKGTAYVAAGLSAGVGRSIGDLDILVPRDRIDDVEAVLLGAGWEWVKPDPYDDAYYRRWMHELPPLIHRERDRMIDVHHTVLPLTARPTPVAAAMIADAVSLGDGLSVLSPEDMICHSAAHMLADGGLEGGLRNLWDMHCLFGEFGEAAGFWERLEERARLHQLRGTVRQAARLAHTIYGTAVPEHVRGLTLLDRVFTARLMSRDGWGREGRWVLGQGFYIRSHLLRMPPAMLARHLWTKWRKGYRPVG